MSALPLLSGAAEKIRSENKKSERKTNEDQEKFCDSSTFVGAILAQPIMKRNNTASTVVNVKMSPVAH